MDVVHCGHHWPGARQGWLFHLQLGNLKCVAPSDVFQISRLHFFFFVGMIAASSCIQNLPTCMDVQVVNHGKVRITADFPQAMQWMTSRFSQLRFFFSWDFTDYIDELYVFAQQSITQQ